MTDLSTQAQRIGKHRFVCSIAVGLVVLALGSGCANRPRTPEGVVEVPACRQAADATDRNEFANPQTQLEIQADAYAICMQEHGYVLNQDALDTKMRYEEQVQNGKWLGGDPFFYLKALRQKLRMSPAYWQVAAK